MCAAAPRLLQEVRDVGRVAPLAVRLLDRDAPPGRGVVGEVHAAERAGPQNRFDVVLPELRGRSFVGGRAPVPVLGAGRSVGTVPVRERAARRQRRPGGAFGVVERLGFGHPAPVITAVRLVLRPTGARVRTVRIGSGTASAPGGESECRRCTEGVKRVGGGFAEPTYGFNRWNVSAGPLVGLSSSSAADTFVSVYLTVSVPDVTTRSQGIRSPVTL